MKNQNNINRIINCLNKFNFMNMNEQDTYSQELIKNFGNQNTMIKGIINNNDQLTMPAKADHFFNLFVATKNSTFIYEAAKLSTDYQFVAWVAKSLATKDFNLSLKIKNTIKNNWDQKIVDLFFDNLSLTEDDIELFADLIGQNKISEFYKNQNQPQTITTHGWYNDSIKIDFDEATEIGEFKGSKLYGYIPENCYTDQFQNALEKGFAKTAKGTNGIKLINDVLLEVKINADARLYSTQLHQNDLGEFIVIFDHLARHKEISKIANSTKELTIFEDCLGATEVNIDHLNQDQLIIIGDTDTI